MNKTYAIPLSQERATSATHGPFDNQDGRGLTAVIDITGRDGSTTLTATILGYDPVSGKTWTLLASSALSSVATTVLKVFPGSAVSANASANDQLPKQFKIKTEVANGTNLVAAYVTLDPSGSNNNITYTAVTAGAAGNSITVTYVVSGNNTPLSVSVVGSDITVNIATDGGGSPTSTAAQVIAAIAASTPASALVTAANAASNNGTGTMAAVGTTNLANGTDVAGITGTIGCHVIN
jgi:hypothetical protein